MNENGDKHCFGKIGRKTVTLMGKNFGAINLGMLCTLIGKS